MTAVSILFWPLGELGSHRIEMDITNQRQQVPILLANNGFVEGMDREWIARMDRRDK
jgi:hypothetical protein